MTGKLPFEALSVETLATRLGTNAALCAKIGRDTIHWEVREVGDGNLNLVFIVEGAGGAAVVKQALPYVRLVGDSWPLPLKRSFFEYHALTRQEARAPGSVPAIYHFDEGQALIIMEYLAPPHVILRRALIDGRQLPNIARDIGLFMARTLFRGSDLSMVAKDRKADLALFADNVELCDITENLVFSDPYFDAKMNRHTPQLEGVVAELRADRDLKVEAQRLKHIFAANAETLLHGDLHSGSIMVTDTETRMIDPEFAFYGPMAFDVGMLLANFWMSFFSQRGHEEKGKRDAMRAYLLGVTAETWAVFRAEFSHLWRSERSGMLYQKSLFEDQGDRLGAEQALDHVLHQIWTDLLGFAGIEVHRRILGLAHNADFETIADEELRASCEAKALKFGRHIAVNRRQIHSIDEVNTLAALIEQESSI
ncbi:MULTISPECIES: S-methyl-5-thioribose kinase [unclassified Mesorhizobium]|uniref:S-methyl-5-thioribose kinase n=1 Tax=unclassified Mesorhizobium TaxID=325217 RepID=UPI000BAF884F|nr:MULTISPECIES: S-methyl-5-thioribose kinase [unclassified Mesorhizobium]PBC23914.1 S-methyl-5-thioribose kinase [Mesorhizobium sp. WSM4311]TRD05748.1 S-methyl-5-thioribose kinase [Mesorhizobium sp. WSM4305]